MSKLALSVALDPYEHALDLLSGRIAAEGVEINWLRLPGTPLGARFADRREFDVAELDVADYLGRLSRGDCTVLALPVFLARQFMPGALWVRADGPVRRPADLLDGRLRCATDDVTTGIHMRHWLSATVGLGGTAPWPVMATAELRTKLAAGQIDAGFSLHRLGDEDRRVVRLIGDIAAEEERYYRATRVFPILRVVCLQRDLAERHPWLPASLVAGFEQAKTNSLQRLIGAGMSRYPLPWLNAYVTNARAVFGEDFWPYGIAANRPSLEAVLDGAKRQGLEAPSLTVDGLFAVPAD